MLGWLVPESRLRNSRKDRFSNNRLAKLVDSSIYNESGPSRKPYADVYLGGIGTSGMNLSTTINSSVHEGSEIFVVY